MLSMTTKAQLVSENPAPKSVAFSQITPFNMTTRTGETIDMQALLNAGKTIVIDLSCCWCNPCWNLHQSGVLEDLHNNYGAPGTNELFVIWAEVESRNTDAQITGHSTSNSYDGYTQGDWTNGGTVPYAIVDDASLTSKFRDLYEGSVPTVFMIFPNGYYRDITDETRSSAEAVYAVKDYYPQAGLAPKVSIAGSTAVTTGSNSTFTADYLSVEPITNISWTFEDGNPATASTATATTSWSNSGIHRVILSVSNENGTNSDTVMVSTFDSESIMTYSSETYKNSIGTGGAINWGILFDPEDLSNRNTVTDIVFYVSYAGNYTVKIQEGTASAPETVLATQAAQFTSNEIGDWRVVHFNNPVTFDNSKNLWATIATTDIAYPAAGCNYTRDPFGSMVSLDGTSWMTIQEASNSSLNYTWMIKAIIPNGIGINDVNSSNVVLFPNPADNTINVIAEGVQHIEIIDATGRIVRSLNNDGAIDISNLNQGVYVVRTTTSKGVSVEKFIKK